MNCAMNTIPNDKVGKTLIAIYDMDKTITRRATYNGFLLHMAMKRAPWRLALLPFLLIGLILYAFKIWPRTQLKEFSQSLLIGRRVKHSALLKHLESYVHQVVNNDVYPQLRELVAHEKQAGFRHVMATASYRLYVDGIAERLGFDDVIATDLVTDKGGYVLAKIDGHNCYDSAKLDKIVAWMSAQGLRRQDCFFRAYSDHVSDAPMLEYADQAFATNPHPPLAQLAAAKGWTVLDWR
jgi:HAD superfamily hydrolase (TIGR01490 family)